MIQSGDVKSDFHLRVRYPARHSQSDCEWLGCWDNLGLQQRLKANTLSIGASKPQ